MDGKWQKATGEGIGKLHRRQSSEDVSLYKYLVCLPQAPTILGSHPILSNSSASSAPETNRQPSYRITGTSLDSSVLEEAQRMRALCSLSDAVFLVPAAVYAHEPIIKRLPGAAEAVACQ